MILSSEIVTVKYITLVTSLETRLSKKTQRKDSEKMKREPAPPEETYSFDYRSKIKTWSKKYLKTTCEDKGYQ